MGQRPETPRKDNGTSKMRRYVGQLLAVMRILFMRSDTLGEIPGAKLSRRSIISGETAR